MKNLLLPALLSIFLFAGCDTRHFITDKAYRQKVETQFEIQKELAKNRADSLFSVFNQDLTMEETEAMKFLYAYMPLSDLADYNGNFFLQNVRSSLAARDTFAWGKTVPEDIFRHFVLPIRVNNENLDSSRWVFFQELKTRLKGMSMKQAVLEVNHWCHEKVTYRGTDGRTSSPLATVKTAYGRCGEESTFTVAAMRAAGIPARQCYTPRWAHSDDNHAWVEVWVDGKWHFIGACEPDADLDLAWFTSPARRAMLVNTNVFGDYQGPEDVLLKDPRFTRINVLANYAETRRIVVRVTDEQNNPVDSAIVEFQLYNYAEFYTLHKAFTDSKGTASFLTGYGDLLVWAAKNNSFGYLKVTVKNTDTAVIILSRQPGGAYSETFDMVPPPEIKTESKVSDSMRAQNTRRLEFEDKLRAGYESTFIDSAKSFRLAATLKMNPDTLWYFLKKSRGNWREIIDFITSTQDNARIYIFPLLASISEKDLRDATPEVLADQLAGLEDYPPLAADPGIFNPYILSPRVDNEWLKPYKTFFRNNFEPSFVQKVRGNPDSLASWIRANILTDSKSNWGRAPLTPAGVFALKVADPHSRDILFVAVCRSFGIPARLEPGTRVPQYFASNAWHDVLFEKRSTESNLRGNLLLNADPANDRKPEYYTNFTIEKYDGGFFRSLDYETDPQVGTFPCTLALSPGNYLLVTGSRIRGGTVLASLEFFVLEAGKTETKTIMLRKDQLPPPEYGTINPALFNFSFPEGMALVWVEPDKEPTKHLFADLRLKKAEFESWKGRFVLVFPNEEQMKAFQKKEAASLPRNLVYSFQSTFPVKPSDLRLKQGVAKELPVVVFIDPKGTIRFLSEGYRIGIGDDLLGQMAK